MKKIILIFIFIFISYAKYYSIQLYSSVNLKYAKMFYNSLPTKIKEKSFIYTTDNYYYTVRYLIKDKIYKLKPFTKNLKHYSFVENSYKKIKKYLNKNKTSKKKKVIIAKKNVIISKKKNKIIFSNNKTKLNRKNLDTNISDYIKMNYFLNIYDTYKIKNFLNKKIYPYQKIDAYDLLPEYKNEENEIFNLNNITHKMYVRYFNVFTKTANYIKNYLEIGNDKFYIYKTNLKHKEYYINIRKSNIVSEISIGKNFNKNSIFITADNTKNYLGFNYKYNFGKYKYNGNVYITINNNDIVTLKKELIKQQKIGSIINFQRKRTSENIEFYIAKDYYKKENKKFNEIFFNLSHSYLIHKNIFTTLYFKHINYSHYLTTYSEIGNNLFFGDRNNRQKKVKYYFNPSIFYNTDTGFGYNILLGLNKRIIKSDLFRLEFELNNNNYIIRSVYFYYY